MLGEVVYYPLNVTWRPCSIATLLWDDMTQYSPVLFFNKLHKFFFSNKLHYIYFVNKLHLIFFCMLFEIKNGSDLPRVSKGKNYHLVTTRVGRCMWMDGCCIANH
jgi:hypothetical protein